LAFYVVFRRYSVRDDEDILLLSGEYHWGQFDPGESLNQGGIERALYDGPSFPLTAIRDWDGEPSAPIALQRRRSQILTDFLGLSPSSGVESCVMGRVLVQQPIFQKVRIFLTLSFHPVLHFDPLRL
jgi:hypothetical protein